MIISITVDKQDRIYALLELANEVDRQIIEPKYKKSVTTKEVYYQVANSLLLRNNASIHILAFVGTGLSPESTHEGTSSWASWIPDWRLKQVYYPFMNPYVTNASYRASGTTVADIRPGSLPYSASVRGILTDSIIEFNGRKLNETLPAAIGNSMPLSEVLAFYPSCRALVNKYRYKFPDLNGRVLLRALVADKIDSRRTSARSDVVFDVLEELIRGNDFARISSDGSIGSVLSYGNSIAEACSGRRFCITRRGQLGLVPPGARVGDEVAIFNGAQTPFLIRRDTKRSGITGETAYELVGESYFHRMVDGEMADHKKEAMITLI